MSENIFEEIPEFNYLESEEKPNLEEFIKVVKGRRSVRVFTDENIPSEVLQSCFDMALLAPNSSNLQAWEFYWVRNPYKKEKLVEACLSQPAARTAKELIVAVARTNTWKERSKEMLALIRKEPNVPKAVLNYYEKIVPLAYNQGPLGIFGLIKRILVFLIGFFRPIPREPVSLEHLKIWAVKTVALACENFMLALRAHGFDSCPMEGMDSSRVAKILDLPSDAVVVMVIGAGRRSSKGIYGPRIRFPKEKFIFEI